MLSSLWKIPAGLALFLLIVLLPPAAGLSSAGQDMAAIAVLMAFWWVTEAIPIAATSLLPLVLFPVMGICSMQEAAAPFANHLIFLFLGGFIIAAAIQRWNLHKRIALQTVWMVGFSETRLLLGFMLATAFLSLWISNTATTMIMVPIAMAVVERIKGKTVENSPPGNFGMALMLGTAYAASIGGIGTLIGTPPNIVLANVVEKLYGTKITFGSWLKIGLPLIVVYLPLAWLYLGKIAYKLESKSSSGGKEVIRKELADLGKMSAEEKRVTFVFGLTVLLWLLADPKEFGSFTLPGVRTYLPDITDGTIAMFGAILLFLISASKKYGYQRLLDWKHTQDVPWGILLLFGGGLALADGFKVTGLAEWIGKKVELFAGAPDLVIIIVVITLVIFLTELTSNTATTAMILPILAGVADGVGINPLLLMIPAAIAASCAFMLPVATPPNAIIFGTGQITIPQMAKKGFVMNLMGIVLITILTVGIISHSFK